MWSVAFPVLAKLLDKIIPDKDAREKAINALQAQRGNQEFELLLAQIGVNKVAAASKSMFVAGGRPAAMWCCVAGMFYHYLLFPIAAPVVTHLTGIELIDLDVQELMVMLGGLLGLGGFRSWEKSRGVARER